METAELVLALRDPAAYPFEVAEVGFLETHVSLLFFAGERVYKVKKPVDLGFLDFSTLERRRHFCEEEVRLNRRLAPDTYLGVVEFRRDAAGAVRVGGAGELVEPAVEMRRLPAERMLEALLERGEVDNQLVRALAVFLARFHAEAATGPGVDEHGSPEAVAANVRENFEQTRGFAGGKGARTISSALHAFLERRAERFLAERRELLERRVREGRIRDGHGDLHSGNVCFPPERIVIYDCIEFSARYRCSDVACDLAFLAMDLDLRGFRGFGRFLEHAYAGEAGDVGLAELTGFYKEYRAVVRAKVQSILASDEGAEPERREAARLSAMRYWHLAASYGLPPALILVCGLPGSGKSWAARELGRPFEAVVLSSDVIRKRLAGVPLTERRRGGRGSREELYSTEMTDRTYRAMLAEAERALASGRTVIADATFASLSRRADFRALARDLGVPFALVHVTASEALVRQRMERRRSDEHEVSDADFAVYRLMQRQFQPPDELPPTELVEMASGSEPPEEATARLIDLLVEGSSPR
ncbi:MAG TPA: AAA family ATPase [Planctomycetota bacterium]|nr:AAA family ATPase [Planctomycetota bacterium]